MGVQCVDCVEEAAAARPKVRTAVGGRARDGRPTVTLGLIGLNVAIYLASMVVAGLWTTLVFAPSIGSEHPYRFLTSAFLHGGALHLAVNMYALWIVGSVLEPALGRWRYICLYLVSAVGGSIAVLLLSSPDSTSWTVGTVGASGAVFGMFAAVFLVLRRLGRDATQILILLAINFALGFAIANISWQAHLGGMVTGALLSAAYVYAPRERRTLVAVLATITLTVVLVVAAYLRYVTT
ncbi:rhomboid family intramembrane serine protease [Georgenia sp. 10Sc9-8]|uniref:Rhomboid family intramembrane serine protease n=1 Tax=Georgenia halotolerans TaxID=3028317 RepID=A0ABT5TZ20_9MICO|nr:rhomboid family intramembrane serine protease [Georgenia halotolerans]